MPGARAQEAARLISLSLGDLCVLAMASEDRRTFGPFAVDSRREAMTEMMRAAIDSVVDPAMEDFLERFGLSTIAFVAMRGEHGPAGVIGMGRGPGRPAYKCGPEAFMPVAERFDLTEAIHRWVLRRALAVEVKETAVIAGIQRARAFAEALARRGFRVALDDFGAGLGSFSSLRALPIDYLKIDGQFVADEETLELLAELGVDLAQGFHVGRPRPMAEV